jgi:aryl-alcohol dehydrogenase-like predicted oxidoreductase
MEFRQLGRSGLQVPVLSLGTATFGGSNDFFKAWGGTQDAEARRLIDVAMDAGVVMFDTADVYSGGLAEAILGRALAGRRSDVLISTKGTFRMGPGPNDVGSSRHHLIAACEASLRRLGTDYIDLYQLHGFDAVTPIDETLRALDDLVRAGKVRYIGTSTFAAWQVVESLWVSKELGLNRVICEQPPYNLLDRRVERELLPMAQTYGIATIPWSPLAGGLLTGKYRRGRAAPEDSRYADGNPMRRRRMTEQVYDVVEALDPMAESRGVTLSQLALAWVMDQPGVTSPIIGPRTMEQLEDNLGALEIAVTDDERKQLDDVVPPGGHVAPFYEAPFGPHPHRVP